MALEKYMLKQVEVIRKTSKVAEVLNDVTFTIAERIPSGYFVVTAKTERDKEVRVHKYFEHRIVDERSLNFDFMTLINNYHKSIEHRISIITSNYETDWEDQHAVLTHLESREKCKEYIEGLWEFILNQFK